MCSSGTHGNGGIACQLMVVVVKISNALHIFGGLDFCK